MQKMVKRGLEPDRKCLKMGVRRSNKQSKRKKEEDTLKTDQAKGYLFVDGSSFADGRDSERTWSVENLFYSFLSVSQHSLHLPKCSF